jgi:YVTN family beta-propeller protein
MLKRVLAPAAIAALLGGAALAAAHSVILPNGWRLSPSAGPIAKTGPMPQGLALSPDGALLAVVESGVPKPELRILQTPGLREVKVVPLKGAFGNPVWVDNHLILVAGANTDAALHVDVRDGSIIAVPVKKGSWPAAVAFDEHGGFARANDGTSSVTVGGVQVRVGDHPSDVVYSKDLKTLYASVRGDNMVAVIDASSKQMQTKIAVGLHPAALALSSDGTKLYVAESDDDAVGVIDVKTNKLIAQIHVGMGTSRADGFGASPNALAVHGNDLFVSLGAENAVALVRNGHVVERIPAGWYPTGVAVGKDGTLYVSDGKGEGMPANPQFNPLKDNSPGYVGDITLGSIRAIPRSAYANASANTASVLADAAPDWTPAPQDATILRANGPIEHVIYIIKENRTYDQVLGDVTGANGDASLTMFGARITPNQHEIARRFGVFDNAYTDAQVSANGHNWTDAGFANDYVERFWPPNYGGRRHAYDFQDGTAPDVPHNGYLWDAAARAHVTFRDYGEDIDFPGRGVALGVNTFPGLRGKFDPAYIGWDLSYSDLSRYAEWLREFKRFVANGNLPQFEIVYLPNDHTSGTYPGAPTPFAYVATNDWALGKLVDTVSHSRYWKSTAIFVLEDDAQDGPDHVSDQRSTFYIASPYAVGGVQHGHYSTVSVVHSIELLLGLQPLSIYDETARPLYAAFATHVVNGAPFDAMRPAIDLNARNAKTAYGAARSTALDFSHPDAADPRVLNDILAHAARPRS